MILAHWGRPGVIASDLKPACSVVVSGFDGTGLEDTMMVSSLVQL